METKRELFRTLCFVIKRTVREKSVCGQTMDLILLHTHKKHWNSKNAIEKVIGSRKKLGEKKVFGINKKLNETKNGRFGCRETVSDSNS